MRNPKTALLNSSVDVFCASKTWLNEGVPSSQVAVTGFNLVRYGRIWKEGKLENNNNVKVKKGRGLICYVRKGLEFNSDMYEN